MSWCLTGQVAATSGAWCLKMPHDVDRPNGPAHPLISKPRGKWAQYTNYICIVLCMLMLYLKEESLYQVAQCFTFHFMALQIGALLKGVCYFSEEIHHVRSRYCGSYWRALNACLNVERHVPLMLICGCAYLTLLSQNGLQLCLSLMLVCLCQLLNTAFRLHRPSTVEISEICEKYNHNVAYGLAWSYYVGYLKIVLPRLKDSIEEFNRTNNNLLKWKETWKLHILIPLSCEIYDDLQKADSNIHFWRDLPELRLDQAGTKGRVYKQNVYEVIDEDRKLNYCIVEYATPLKTLFTMSHDESAAFSREDRLEQAKLFYRTLEEILQNSKECAGSYRLIVYEESGASEGHFLSKEILRHIRQQHCEEYAMCNGNHHNPQPTDVFSTEPDLLISDSELPRPLRSDAF
ncbi:stimulator of interferon genes protein [Alligator mississippiensis]|uniref:Stimulator of interferon genes protein n=2 Tax=Alligator mississippiensis TaxID=8496 RepID=A0A151NQS6_ALLMI|nr:stimulator of interferon genes protein [Alligator mississippiensis]